MKGETMTGLKRKICILTIAMLITAPSILGAGKGDFPDVLTMRERVETVNSITQLRLEKLLPEAMRSSGFDMWIIPCQEDNVDAVFRTMTPMNTWNRRDLMLVFYDLGPERGVERMDISRMNMRGFHTRVWDNTKETRWECLERIVKERDPKKIGINR